MLNINVPCILIVEIPQGLALKKLFFRLPKEKRKKMS